MVLVVSTECRDREAAKAIITSHLFLIAKSSIKKLQGMVTALGGERQNLVITLSRRQQQSYNRQAK